MHIHIQVWRNPTWRNIPKVRFANTYIPDPQLLKHNSWALNPETTRKLEVAEIV